MQRHDRPTTTRRGLVLRLLREAGARGVTTGDLLAAGVGSRYSARLLELRELGYEITSERVARGSWRYCLVREPVHAAAAAEDDPGPRQGALFDRARHPGLAA